MTRTLRIIILAILLSGCVPALQSVHDQVYPIFTGVDGLKVAQWDNGRLRGNCTVFAKEVLSRALERGLEGAETVVVWRNEGDVLTGYRIIWHMVVIWDGYVSHNLGGRFVETEKKFFERWTRK